MLVGWTILVDWQGESNDEAVRAVPIAITQKVEGAGASSWVVPPVPVHVRRFEKLEPNYWLQRE